jgi:hypothetical protein
LTPARDLPAVCPACSSVLIEQGLAKARASLLYLQVQPAPSPQRRQRPDTQETDTGQAPGRSEALKPAYYYLIANPWMKDERIKSIKSLRSALGLGLKEAKEMADLIVSATWMPYRLSEESAQSLTADGFTVLPGVPPARHDPDAPEVRIRIACVINNRGEWNALGWKIGSEPGKDDDFTSTEALDPADLEVLHWIEASVPIPTIPSLTIEGEVTA